MRDSPTIQGESASLLDSRSPGMFAPIHVQECFPGAIHRNTRVSGFDGDTSHLANSSRLVWLIGFVA